MYNAMMHFIKSITITILLLTYCSTTFAFLLVLKQNNINKLESIVSDISNYKSSNYGKYLSKEQIIEIIKPSNEQISFIYEWLNSCNITKKQTINYGDVIEIPEFQKRNLKCLFNISTIIIEKNIVITNDTYVIPKYIDFIGGLYTDKFIQIRSKQSGKYNSKQSGKYNSKQSGKYNSKQSGKYNSKQSGKQSGKHSGKHSQVDPGYVGRESECKLYSINCTNAKSNYSIGVIEFQSNPAFNQNDLLMSQFNNNLPNMTISQDHIIGPLSSLSTESQLDVQMISQIHSTPNAWFWTVNGWMYEFAVSFFNTNVVPNVISISWGWIDSEQCDITACGINITSQQYITRTNNEYLKIVARGITICASSGDSGAPGTPMCNGKNPINPQFPASSQWVTAVGGTFVNNKNDYTNYSWKTPLCQNNACSTGTSESISNYDYVGWTSGGGFGLYSKRPVWQNASVQKYLNSDIPFPKSFNKLGRAYPDVSAYSHNCPTWTNNILSPVDGTSCSSPIFAGIVAILNEHQISKSKPVLGYLNPLLYQMYEDDGSGNLIFTDIVDGNNYCTENMCCETTDFGYTATQGYDTVGGLGTVNVTRMIEWLDINT
jgi:subtilase family serine protease